MKILHLSHDPHFVHQAFANSIHAETKVIPFKSFIAAVKRHRFLQVFFPTLCLFYSFTLDTHYDVLLIEGGSAFYVGAFMKLRNRKLKLIFIDTDAFFFTLRYTFAPLTDYALKKIDRVLCESTYTPCPHKQFISNASYFIPVFPRKLRKYKTKREERSALYLGRLDPEKNPDRVITAAKSSNAIQKLSVVGEGVISDTIQKLMEGNEKLQFIGPEYTGKYYYKAQFFIHLPDYDAYPVAVLEAMIAGCIPIVSRGCGVSKLLPKKFVVEDPTDYVSLEKSILYHSKHYQQSLRIIKNLVPKIKMEEECVLAFQKAFYKAVNSL